MGIRRQLLWAIVLLLALGAATAYGQDEQINEVVEEGHVPHQRDGVDPPGTSGSRG